MKIQTIIAFILLSACTQPDCTKYTDEITQLEAQLADSNRFNLIDSIVIYDSVVINLVDSTVINQIDSFVYDTVYFEIYDTITFIDTIPAETNLPPGMDNIFSTNFSDTELSIYDDGNDWNYSTGWDNSNFTAPLKIQTEVESVNSPLTDYAEATVDEAMSFTVYKLDGVSSGTRLQLQGSLERSDISKVYISFDMWPSSDIKKAYDLYGNSCSFVFSEFHYNGSGYGTRARLTYIDNKVVYHANCKKDGSTIWAAGDPPDGRVEMQFDQWSHIEILCEVETNETGRYRIWVTNKGNTNLAVDESQMLGYPIKSNIHWFKNYPDGDIMSISGGIEVIFDNLDIWVK